MHFKLNVVVDVDDCDLELLEYYRKNKFEKLVYDEVAIGTNKCQIYIVGETDLKTYLNCLLECFGYDNIQLSVYKSDGRGPYTESAYNHNNGVTAVILELPKLDFSKIKIISWDHFFCENQTIEMLYFNTFTKGCIIKVMNVPYNHLHEIKTDVNCIKKIIVFDKDPPYVLDTAKSMDKHIKKFILNSNYKGLIEDTCRNSSYTSLCSTQHYYNILIRFREVVTNVSFLQDVLFDLFLLTEIKNFLE